MRAIAVEREADRCAMIGENAAALGVPHLELVAGVAPAAPGELSPPDAVFIGGGLTTPGLVERCWQALNRGGRLVANAVTVEGEARLFALRAEIGELTRIAVSRAEPVGAYTWLAPAHARDAADSRDQAMTGTVYGLGVGPGDPELLTLKALRILRAAPVIAYPAPETGDSFARSDRGASFARRSAGDRHPHAARRRPASRRRRSMRARPTRSSPQVAAGRDVAVLCEGDPFFYGSFLYLYERLVDRCPVQVVPGVVVADGLRQRRRPAPGAPQRDSHGGAGAAPR